MTDSELLLDYNNLVKIKRKKYRLGIRTLWVLILAMSISCLVLFFLPKAITTHMFIFILLLLILAFGVVQIIMYVVYINASDKTFYSFLVKSIVLKIAADRSMELTYTASPDDFNSLDSGIFPGKCSISANGLIQSNLFNIYLDITVPSENYVEKMYDLQANYIVINLSPPFQMQIKSDYRAFFKDLRLKKIKEDMGELNVYIPKNSSENHSYIKYLRYMYKLKEKLCAKNIYLFFNRDKIYFAYECDRLKIDAKRITVDTLDAMKREIELTMDICYYIIALINTSILEEENEKVYNDNTFFN